MDIIIVITTIFNEGAPKGNGKEHAVETSTQPRSFLDMLNSAYNRQEKYLGVMKLIWR